MRNPGPVARLLGAQVAVAAAAIFARYALAGAGPLAVSAARLTLAAVVLLALAAVTRNLHRVSARREFALALAGCALALHFAAWIASLLYTSVAISTLLVATVPLWTELYDVVAERRRPPRSYVLAVVMAGTGLALIVGQHAAPAPQAGHALAGAFLALLGGVAMALYLVIVRGAGMRGAALGTRAIVTRTYAVAAGVLVVAAAGARQAPPALHDGSAWLGIGGMAVFSQLLGHTALNAALRDFSPSTVALATLLEPVAAAALAALLLREPVSLATAAGGALVLAAVAVALRAGYPPVENPG